MEPGRKGMESAVGVAVPPALRTSGPQRPDHGLGSPAEPLDHETGPCGVKTSDGCQPVRLPWETDSNPERPWSPGRSCWPPGQPQGSLTR